MKVSVVTASFNSAATIGHTLRSVDDQTHSDIEHLIIDGGSRDATLAIVTATKSRVTTVLSEPDRGIYDAMNKGLLRAAGDIVGTLNSDDFYTTEHVIATVVEAFAADPALDAVYGDLCYVSQRDERQVVRYWRSSAYEGGAFLRGWVPPHPTFFARRRVYEHFGGFDLHYRLAADFELMARLFEIHRIRTVHIPRVLVNMRLGGATNRNWANVMEQNREIWRALKVHGLKPSLPRFALGKLLSRGRQFFRRPTSP